MKRVMKLRLRRRRSEEGYFAILAITMFVTLFGLTAFAVDVGNWYVTGQKAQKAADAAALAGVPSLPGDQTSAFSTAQKYSKTNGFDNADANTVVTTGIDGTPTRLRVTVTTTVDNVFGGLFGINKTTITRSAVADFAGPVPMGSPCNEFGNDPESTGFKSTNCADAGQFWANVGSPAANKRSGDAYQNNVCTSGDDGCVGTTTNNDYDPNGYFYTLTLTEPVSNLTIQAFDPALIDVGDNCDLAAAKLPTAAGLGSKAVVSNPSVRYAAGSSSPFCTGDIRFGGTGQVSTQFTIRKTGGNPWDPTSYPIATESTCTPKTFPGFSGDLSRALDKTITSGSGQRFDATVAANFRQWVPICTLTSAPAGTYMVQVKTNGTGNDLGNGHNRFGLRAFGSSSTAKDKMYFAAYNKMAIYANLPSATTIFYLAKVPTGSGGQILNVRLFDVGDSAGTGTISVLAPADSNVTFKNCTGLGPVSGTLSSCSIQANSSTHQGKWQTIAVPIPSNYTCDDASATGCWVKLKYAYGSGNQPNDTTSWSASIEGDPVRLVE